MYSAFEMSCRRRSEPVKRMVACGLLAMSASIAHATVLRVCAEPHNLPFSDVAGNGFENRIAELVAKDLGRQLRYVWVTQGHGFLRKTLDAKLCDMIVGWPERADGVLTTGAYYRAGYRFVFRSDRVSALASYDDPQLRALRVGVPIVGDDAAQSPPAAALSRRRIVDNVRGFPVFGATPASERMAAALADGTIDVAVLWAPQAAFVVRQSTVTLGSSDARDPGTAPPDFAMAMAVRETDTDLRASLDAIRERDKAKLDQILSGFGVLTAAPVATAGGRS
jgi:mxaJ protein